MLARKQYIRDTVRTALASGRKTLSEGESKRLLRAARVHVVKGRLVGDANAAAQASSQIGFPVTLKASGTGIWHKTDLGLIQWDLSTKNSVSKAYKRIASSLKRHSLLGSVDGILVEEHLAQAPELILGFRRDPSLGPMVMLGAGGIYTERIDDVAFALAPVSAAEVRRMLRQLRCFPILAGGYRGLRKNDLDSIVHAVLALAGKDGLGLSLKELSVVDINPIRLYPYGYYVLDAKIRLSEPPERDDTLEDGERPGKEILSEFAPLFRPKSVAYVGASPTSRNIVTQMMRATKDMGFTGSIYPIHPKAQSIDGSRAYRNLAEVPEVVDLACVGISANSIPDILNEAKGKAKFAHILSGGFGEMGKSGHQLEAKVLAAARAAGMRILGPNCMGVHCPEGKITCIDGAELGPGVVGFVSQSGGFGTDAIRRGNSRGLAFSKVITVGNSIDLDCADFIRYLAIDPKTDVILVYVESVRNGRAFFQACKLAALRKPVFILRGGLSKHGSRAALSHTGRLSGGRTEWFGLIRQAGAVPVHSLDELLDAAVAIQGGSLPQGRRLLLCGQGGGASVVAADAAQRLGLSVPPLDAKTRTRVELLGLPPGTSRDNPIDAPVGTLQVDNGGLFRRLVETVSSRHRFDLALMHINLQMVVSFAPYPKEVIQNFIETAAFIRQRGLIVLVVLRTTGEGFLEDYRTGAAVLARQYKLPVFQEINNALMAVVALRTYADLHANPRRDQNG